MYSASYVKLREATADRRHSDDFLEAFHAEVARSGGRRNLFIWTQAPNIDPEGVFSPYQLRGVEMGQLPQTRSVGFQVTLVP